MRNKIKILASAFICAGILTGCGGMFTGEKAPNKVEQALYNTQTNFITKTIVVTNTVTQVVPQIEKITTTNGVTLYTTNTFTQNQVVYQTNQVQVPVYSMTPSANAESGAQTAGSIGNMIFPGSGGLITGAIAMLLATWGRMRSSKATSVGLAQEVESIREFIKALPQGTKYDTAITGWLQQHQLDTGIASNVLDIVQNQISNSDAKAAVTEISATLKQFGVQPPAPTV